MNGSDIVPLEAVRAALDREPESAQEAQTEGPSRNWTFWQKQFQAGLQHEKNFRSEGTHSERLYFGPVDDAATADPQGDRVTQVSEKTALIHLGLEALIARESARRLAELGGSQKKLRPIPRRRSGAA